MKKGIKKRILNKIQTEPGNEEQLQILISCLKHLMKITESKSIEELLSLNVPILSPLNKFAKKEWQYINTKLKGGRLTIRECQVKVQKTIPREKRKELAAYFTNDQGIKLMKELLKEYDKKYQKEEYSICDPFLGSARTLTAIIDHFGPKRIKMVWGIEPYFLSALTAYTALLNAMEGDRAKVTVINGDAFQKVPEFIINNSEFLKMDFILTNPPFTRWEYLTGEQQKQLTSFTKTLGYKDFLERKDTGLQTYSMFLCDIILKKGGVNITVLPLSSFYTIGGRGYKNLLRKKYKILALVESAQQASFSIDSGFKEIILIVQKEENQGKTLFTKLEKDIQTLAKAIFSSEKYLEGEYYNLKEIPSYLDNNWLSLFPNGNKIQKMIIEILNKGIKEGMFNYWDKILGKEKIVRGFEMYGPDFFFLPNKHWVVLKEGEKELEIYNKKRQTKLNIPKNYLIKALRKPKLYYKTIEPTVDTYGLSIPEEEIEELPKAISSYIQWGIQTGTPKAAINKFGKYWYSHINKTIKTKEPFSHVFISDKVDLKFKKRSTFANYTSKKLSASKNFYLVKNLEEKISKCLCAWLNSSFFMSILIFLSRKISETWTRLLIDDYLELPLIDFNKIKEEEKEKINKSFDEMRKRNLPAIPKQMNTEYRKKLDLTIAEAINISEPESFVKELHENLKKYFKLINEK